LVARRAKSEDDLRLRFERAKSEGDLPGEAEAAALARYVQTILQGMAVQAVSGTKRADLRNLVDMVLTTWPPVTGRS
jgi:hypothetical protein